MRRYHKQKKNEHFYSFFQVEATGIEPVSKHILQKLSTCLFCFIFFGN